MKVRTRVYLLGLLPALLVAAVLAAYLSLSRLADLEASQEVHSDSLARYIAQGVEYPVLSGNYDPLTPLLKWALREKGVSFAAVYRPDGEPIALAGRFPDDFPAPLAEGVVRGPHYLITSVPVVLAPLPIEDPYLAGIEEPTRTIAWVQVTMDRGDVAAASREVVLAALGIVALGMLFAAALVRGMALVGIRPLMEVIAAVRRIRAGDFRSRLAITADSELKELQEGINQMCIALESFQQDMQRRVDAATAELTAQKEAAEQANQAKTRFLAAASHDLRQPIYAMSLFIAAMKPQVLGRGAALTLDKIEAALSTMEDLFNAILDVSKLEAGVVTPHLDHVPLAAMLQRLAADFSYQATSKGLRLRVRCREVGVESDPILLERILRNLIANALRYTDQGGLLIATRRRGERLRVQVWDTGVGIPAEHIPHIFEEFYQASDTRRDHARGLGLGLAIVDRLARLLRHRLEVRSEVGRGTVFSLDLPICRQRPPAAAFHGEDLANAGRMQGRALVVEDDPTVTEALASLLAGWGLEVTVAGSAAEALDRLERAPDIMITDYHLAGEEGLAVARRVRAAYSGEAFPVIVVTADTSAEGVRRLDASGFPVLHKPVRPARLRSLIASQLRHKTIATSAEAATHSAPA